jgi:hypothetical protein
MLLTSRFLIVVSLVAVPFGAIAQSNPTGNLGSNTSVTAAAGTADKKAASGMSTGDVGAKSHHPPTSAANRRTPGGTGTSVVAGDNSTVRGDRAATIDQKTGAFTK